MEQFDLSVWLKDKSRKVVTRLKKSVQIISIEGKEDIPIVALVEGVAHQYKPNGYHADVVVAYSNQCRDMGDYDLFFADEKDKLTEFEKAVKQVMWTAYNYDDYSNGKDVDDISNVKATSKSLLDLARKEILKDLPKWKKAKKNEELDCHVAIQQDDRVVLSDFVQKDEYYITLDILKTLPKEE